MAKISFRTKLIKVHNPDDSFAFTQINVPDFKRHHCDMHGFRTHSKYGGFANSDLFPSILKRVKKEVAPLGFWKLEELPQGVEVETNGFFATVTFEV